MRSGINRQSAGAVRRFISYMWQGPDGLRRSLRLEWRFVAIRWLGIATLAPGLLLANLALDRLMAAYAVLLIAVVYNAGVWRSIQRHPEWVASGYVTVLGDAMLNAAMMGVAGGYDTPFYYILFTVTISAAMRFGYASALGMAATFVAFDLLEDVTWFPVFTPPALSGPFFFRSGFLCITAILAGYLREQAVRAESALQERLRQANLLNEATASLGASLEFERVLEAAAIGAAHLLGGWSALLVQSAELAGEGASLPRVVRWPLANLEEPEELVALCHRYVGRDRPPASRDLLLFQEILPSGQRVAVLVLARSTQQGPLAAIAVPVAGGLASKALAADILASFVERTSLAIENASLYRTLAGRSSALQQAYAELARAHEELLSLDEMKTNFLANVSHELRTPLNSIRSFSELLLTYEDPTVRGEFLQIINSESERLTRLINDVLDIVKIEAGHMDWQMKSTDLAAVIHDCGRVYRPLIENEGLLFQVEAPDDLPPVYADSDRLQQVLGNLLNNAAKFTPQGSIRLGAVRRNDEIHVYVADSGMGIASENQARIFDKFQQVGDTLTGKPRGTGLGLAICREIVAHHAGRIWVESRPGSGSTFSFSLPVAARTARGFEPSSGAREAVVAGA